MVALSPVIFSVNVNVSLHNQLNDSTSVPELLNTIDGSEDDPATNIEELNITPNAGAILVYIVRLSPTICPVVVANFICKSPSNVISVVAVFTPVVYAHQSLFRLNVSGVPLASISMI